MATVQNIVSSVNLGYKLDLDYLARNLINIEYNPTKFGAAIKRIKKPRTTCLIFSSGQLIITGAKSMAESCKAARIFARKIQKARNNLQIKTKFVNFNICNIVASFCLKRKIQLTELYNSRKSNCTYVQESFPGLKYKPYLDENVIAIIFNSGKVIITGAFTIKKVNEIYELLNRLLLRFTY